MWKFKHIAFTLSICILVLPFAQSIDTSCTFQGISGNEGCTLIANGNQYSL